MSFFSSVSNRSVADSGGEMHLVRIVEDRRRERATEVDIEARPDAFVVLDRNPISPWLTPQLTAPRSCTAFSVCAEAPALAIVPESPRRRPDASIGA